MLNPGMTLAKFHLQKLNASSEKWLFFILRQGQFHLHLVQYFAFYSCLSLHNSVKLNPFSFTYLALLFLKIRKTTLFLWLRFSIFFIKVQQTYSIHREADIAGAFSCIDLLNVFDHYVRLQTSSKSDRCE